MGDGEGFVLLALFLDAVGPEAVGEVRPVVVAFFELRPGVFELLLPRLEAEEFPEWGGGDLNTVVEVGLPEWGEALELVLEVAEFI